MLKLINGVEENRDEVVKILMGGDEVSNVEDKIVSVVGFKNLANAVFEKIRSQFDCSAFVSLSRNPHMEKLFQDMFYQLAKRNNARINVIGEIREFLQGKRYGNFTVHTLETST